MWRDGVDVAIQNYYKYHIDSLVRLENYNNVRFTRFYGHVNPNLRSSSWDMLRRVYGSAPTHSSDFKDIMDNMALVDIKPDIGWFIWVNNRSGGSMIKERLDRFLMSVSVIENFSFMATSVVRQIKFDHDAIMLDMWGRKPKEQVKDPRLCFRFDESWATDREECPRCGAEHETFIHALKYCPTSQTILSIGGLDNSTISKEYKCCIDWLEDMMRVLDKKAMANLMTTLWNSWNNRNNFIFRGKEDEAQVIWDRARTLSQEFRICNLINDLLLFTNPVVKRWEIPLKGFVKINFVASICDNRVDYVVIARDEEGFVLGGGRGFKEVSISVEEVECYAFEDSIKLTCKLNINTDVIFEMDNAYLVNKVKNQRTNFTIIGA
ncbi:hypothetical protein Goklo_017295 [Gossypium klotzschianum]|uniref:RNase H type-1 domain-containing protein n=1 Tax=Gossypium klotzschianum TaxID=34286 RepID=A0A7J8UHM3_9ROSI|nr:hypothetical protein [Gossypium klotzschianum]